LLPNGPPASCVPLSKEHTARSGLAIDPRAAGVTFRRQVLDRNMTIFLWLARSSSLPLPCIWREPGEQNDEAEGGTSMETREIRRITRVLMIGILMGVALHVRGVRVRAPRLISILISIKNS
jgi:hypothetical protein